MRGSATTYGKRFSLDTLGIYIYVITICVGCWVVGYMESIGFPVYAEVMATPLWATICQILPGKAFTYIIGILLMFGGAFIIHRANYALVLIREKTLLPFLLYILFISTNPDFFPLKSTSVGVFCLILAIYPLLTSYHNPEATGKIYNATLFLGIGSLLWVHILWFLPLFWIGMYSFRSLSLRTFLASLLGVGTVYWFVLGWCVWFGDYSALTIPFSTLLKIKFILFERIDLIDWISILYVAFLTLISSVNIFMYDSGDNIRSHQFLSFLTLAAIWSFGLFFLYEQSSEEFLQIACMPAAILIAHFFTIMRSRYTFWLFHFTILFFIAVLFLRLWNFL